MSKNIQQIYTANPITTNQSTDLMYWGRSPYGTTNDTAITYGNFSAQFGAPYTPSALTSTNDTNVTVTLGGNPTSALLQGVSLTMGWSGLLSTARGGTGINIGATNSAMLVTNASGTPSMTTSMTNGQVVIGSTSGTPTAATLTPGVNIAIANAGGSITIGTSGFASLAWQTIASTSAPLTVNSGFITNNVSLVSLSLPTVAAVGTIIYIQGLGSGGWKVTQNASQNIQIGSSSSTAGTGGSIASTNRYDSLALLCVVANTTWTSLSAPQSSGLTIV